MTSSILINLQLMTDQSAAYDVINTDQSAAYDVINTDRSPAHGVINIYLLYLFQIYIYVLVKS